MSGDSHNSVESDGDDLITPEGFMIADAHRVEDVLSTDSPSRASQESDIEIIENAPLSLSNTFWEIVRNFYASITQLSGNATITAWDAFWKIVKKCLAIAASFTFSDEVVIAIVMLSHLSNSANAIAGISLISTYMNTFGFLGFADLYSMSNVASKYYGKIKNLKERISNAVDEELIDYLSRELSKRKRQAEDINKNGMISALMSMPPIMLIMYFSGDILAKIFGQNYMIALIAQSFLRPYTLAIPGLMLRICFEQLLFSFKHFYLTMMLALGSLVIGTGLSYYLAFVEHLGFFGVAYGFIVESYLTAIAYGFYLALHNDFKDYHFFSIFTFEPGNTKKFLKLMKLGYYILFAVASESLVTFLMTIFAGILGVVQQEAWVFCLQYIYLLFILSCAFGIGCNQEINDQIGYKNYENASIFGKSGLAATIACVAPLPIIFAISPSILMYILNNNQPEIHKLLTGVVPMVSLTVVSEAARYNFLQQLRALKDNFRANMISSGGLFLGTLLAAFLAFETPMDIYGIALGFLLGSLAASIGLFMCWVKRIEPESIAQLYASESDSIESLEQQDEDSTIEPMLDSDNTELLLQEDDDSMLRQESDEPSFSSSCNHFFHRITSGYVTQQEAASYSINAADALPERPQSSSLLSRVANYASYFWYRASPAVDIPMDHAVARSPSSQRIEVEGENYGSVSGSGDTRPGQDLLIVIQR